MSQHVVTSTLTVRYIWFKTRLEQLVQKVSKLECRGNAVDKHVSICVYGAIGPCQEQQTTRKLSQHLVGSKENTTALVVWGNGGFGPTSRCHVAAPNKWLKSLLSKYVAVVTSSEYKSS